MSNVNFNDYLNEQLKDPKFKAEFEAESARLDSAIALTKSREELGLTQRQLSEMASVPQATIARIERGDNTSMATLSKLAFAMNKRLTVGFA